MEQRPWRMSIQTWFGLLALALTIWTTIAYAQLLAEVGGILLGAFLLSLAMKPLVDILENWHVPRGVTVLLVFFALFGAATMAGTLLVPVISANITNLQDNGPELIRNVFQQIINMPVIGQWVPANDIIVQHAIQWTESLLSPAMSAVAGIGSIAIDLFIVLALAFFITTDTKLGPLFVETWIPSHYQPRFRATTNRLHHQLTRWMWAQAAIAFYFAFVFSIGLALLGVPFAFTIGIIGGILEVIPYVGGAIAVFLALFSALTVHPILMLWVAIFYLVVVEIESHVIAPAFYGRVMGLHPAIVLIALLVGAKIAGIIGILFAVPVAVIIAALLREVRSVWITPPHTPAPMKTKQEHNPPVP